MALSEIFRTLTTKGRLYVIENEWLEVTIILQVFESFGIQLWDCFTEEQEAWHERFIKHGFKILSEEPYLNRKINGDDNEHGRAAENLGIQVEMQWKAFIVEKP